jgi:oxygen-independent coproporphyrinogen-3 oxidase
MLLEALSFLSEHVQHISIYDLTIEPGTALEARVASGELHMPDSDELADERQNADARLRELGFIRYEVSNYARPGYECKHNAAYWNMEPYLGIGSGAVSTLHLFNTKDQVRLDSLQRFAGTKNIDSFIEHPADLPEEIENFDQSTALFEVLMMGFRTIRGVDTQRIASQFDVQLSKIIPSTLRRWKQRIIWQDKRISLNPRYFDILNRFLVECLDELS